MSDFQFFVEDHDKLQETIDSVIEIKEACNFCQATPISIIYRGWDDKIIQACEDHKEIVLEMIERAKQ